ncbi:NAD-dependent epimerase/dehydratase family protein [Rubritalea tangerina]|uniref:NAD-dependent epimerase/dehydratase family protein n=1 Tax=Rubritalea tangerina TaxID=430798 RepID=A0ABW4ZDS9_9BACT
MGHLLIVGYGFVGQAVAMLFREAGWEVSTLGRSEGNTIRADISDFDSLSQAVADSGIVPSHVLHCASAGGGGLEAYSKVYQEGAEHLCRLFPRAHILFTSSTSVYPQIDGSLVDESAETEKSRETALCLLAAEKVILSSKGTVMRLAGVYGNGRSYLLRRFLAGEARMEESGERILNHTHHHDAATATLFLCSLGDEIKGGIYNVCDSEPRSQRDTYLGLTGIFGGAVPASAPRNLHSKRGWSNKAVSNKKLCGMGWHPTYPDFLLAAREVAESLE